jgi:hypothetical protein
MKSRNPKSSGEGEVKKPLVFFKRETINQNPIYRFALGKSKRRIQPDPKPFTIHEDLVFV